MRDLKILLVALAGLWIAGAAWGQATAVRFSRLIPMNGSPIADAVVVVENTRIKAVGQEMEPCLRAPE